MNGLAFQTLQDQVKIIQANHSYSKVEFCVQQLATQTEHLLILKSAQCQHAAFSGL